MKTLDRCQRRQHPAAALVTCLLFACSTESAAPVATRVVPTPVPSAKVPAPGARQTPPPVSARELPADAKLASPPAVEALPVPKARIVELAPPSVELRSQGEAPLAKRSLSPKRGSTAALQLVMRMRMGMRVGEKDIAPTQLPEIKVGLATKVEKVTKDNVEYSFSVTSVARDTKSEVSERVLKAVDRGVEGMRETKGTITLNRSGRVEASSLGLPELSSPGLRPSLAGFTQSFAQLYPVFPEEAVGVGASWVSTEQFELSGIPIQQTATYTLRSINGSVLELDVTFEQAAIGKVKSPKAVEMAVTSFGGRGRGTITFDLSAVAPKKASSSSATQTSSTVTMGTGGEGVRMDLVLDLAISSS